MKRELLVVLFVLVLAPGLVSAHRPSIRDLRNLRDQIDMLVNASVGCPSNASTRFVDNGDGTICDSETGLMWEMKDPSDGAQDLSNPHDVDNNYSWSEGAGGDFTNPDGTVFTDFLPRLNGVIAGSAATEQLGGYSDWRLPTSAELQTILDCSYGSPCIDPIFGPTGHALYWTSTAYADNLMDAWHVNFNVGGVLAAGKGMALRVRAVRGGM